MKLTFTVIALLMSCIFATPITVAENLWMQDDPPSLQIVDYTLAGTGCLDRSSGIIRYLDNATVTIIFDKFKPRPNTWPNRRPSYDYRLRG